MFSSFEFPKGTDNIIESLITMEPMPISIFDGIDSKYFIAELTIPKYASNLFLSSVFVLNIKFLNPNTSRNAT